MIKKISLAALTLLFAAAAVSADTVIEFRYDSQHSQFLTNGKHARINTRNSEEFMLVDFASKTIYSVDPAKKQVFNYSNSMPSITGFEPPKIRVDVKPAGKGPQIAGYETRKYRLSADGDYCGTIYASRDAVKGTAVESLFDTLKSMGESHLKSLGGFAAIIPACQMARIRLTEKLAYIGAPMRVIDIEGKVESEITRIVKNARVEPASYSIPKGYAAVSIDERIEQAKQDSREDETAPASRSENRREMREMRRSGRLPPDWRR